MITNWCNQWKIKLNPNKTQYVIFKKNIKQEEEKLNLYIGTTIIKSSENMKILGINFDKQCSMIKHCKEREKIVYRRSALIKKVGGKRWGANKKIKLQLYKQYIRPVLEYGNMVTSKSCITAKGILGLAERTALRSITTAE